MNDTLTLLVLAIAPLLLAAILLWRRRVRRLRDIARRERLAKLREAARSVAKVPAMTLPKSRGKTRDVFVPREPEIPKIEHDGEWHTLH